MHALSAPSNSKISLAVLINLEVTNFGWWCFPIIVFTVQISDRYTHEFIWGHVVKAAQIHCIKLAPARRASDAERTNAAVLAKQMLVRLGQELVFGELSLARQQAKRAWLYDGRPKPRFGANRAITADRTLAEVNIRLKPNYTTMTASMIGLQLRSTRLRIIQL